MLPEWAARRAFAVAGLEWAAVTKDERIGWLAGFSTYALWGVFPLRFVLVWIAIAVVIAEVALVVRAHRRAVRV